MCFIGPQGRDIGLALSFPIGCLICFGLNGQIEANESIEVYITSSLDEYLELMSEAGKSARYVVMLLVGVDGSCTFPSIFWMFKWYHTLLKKERETVYKGCSWYSRSEVYATFI